MASIPKPFCGGDVVFVGDANLVFYGGSGGGIDLGSGEMMLLLLLLQLRIGGFGRIYNSWLMLRCDWMMQGLPPANPYQRS